MDFLYSLYDALVSINVPNEKARAVVDAMERDMATSLATKTDLDSLRLATKADVELLRHETTSGFAAARKDLDTGLALVRRDMEAQGAALRQEIALLRKDVDAQGSQIVIRLGAVIVVVAGLILGAIRLGAAG